VIEQYEAYLFDLDGVITPTVLLHRRAWREVCAQILAAHAAAPYSEADYFASLDGRPRFAGVAHLLASRRITLPDGHDSDDGFDTIHGIGNRKNRVFSELLAHEGIEAYPGTRALVARLTAMGKKLAVVSSSRNAEAVLAAAGMRSYFSLIVDGEVAAAEDLPGKPAPDTFLRAAQLIGATPESSVVFEDAASGVAAGRAGGFGLVVGVDRGAGRSSLLAAGARVVVTDLGELE